MKKAPEICFAMASGVWLANLTHRAIDGQWGWVLIAAGACAVNLWISVRYSGRT